MRPALLESFQEIRDKNMLTFKEAKERGVKVAGHEFIHNIISFPLCSDYEERVNHEI
ncbi:MAG: hypothetical protein PHP87_05665 [Syntrophomonas sp.]|uniref:hypothetical protein n=1 Tax=Syntrophomonas sp. TaxID=2053627 RepID=UPI002623C45C|nr:hypothetical protein [Syntrophomonas sp.]MDD4626554.1 hypothetical protein [Syntrophomonas sp.]